MRAPRRMARESFRAALTCAVLCAACSELPSKLPEALFAADPGPQLLQGRHAGPPVVAAPTGPARFVAPLYEQFDLSRALDCVRFVDGFYRAPANDGYEASLEHVAARLRAAGFGVEAGFELTTIETQLTARAPNSSERVLASAWTPLDARIAMIGADGVERVLHAFETPEGRDRVMLPVNARTVGGNMMKRGGGSVNVLGSPLARAVDSLVPGEKHQLHGFTDKMKWDVIRQESNAITFALESRNVPVNVEGAKTLADIIGNVRFEQTYGVSDQGLASAIQIINQEKLYWFEKVLYAAFSFFAGFGNVWARFFAPLAAQFDKSVVLGGGYHPFYQLYRVSFLSFPYKN